MNKIQSSTGFWVFNYYLFKRWFNVEPNDIDDFFDGLNCIPIFMEIESNGR